MTWKVLITDYVWPSTDPERAVLEAGGASVVVAPNGEEATLAELARDADAIMTCFAQVTENVVRAAEQCIVIGRFRRGSGQHRGKHGHGVGHRCHLCPRLLR